MNFLRTYQVGVATAALLMSGAVLAQQYDPVAQAGDKSQGTMPASIFRAQIGPLANVKQADGTMKANVYKVVRFQLSIIKKRGEYVGPYEAKSPTGTSSVSFSDNPKMMDAISRIVPGDKVVIENIRAIGPDKISRQLNSITLLMN